MKKFLGYGLAGLVGLALLLFLAVYGAGNGWFGSDQTDGVAVQEPMPDSAVTERAARQQAARQSDKQEADKQILFGDLHIHTTFSVDAYSFSLPLLYGEGSKPPSDACDFARYCSQLDFWSINDHVEGMPRHHWEQIVDSIRQCNAITDKGAQPDTVAFLGWEWTQIGTRPENHYGHKNVILRDLEDDKIPARPISSSSPDGVAGTNALNWQWTGAAALLGGGQRAYDMAAYLKARTATKRCPTGVPVRDLPLDCEEAAERPDLLFAKLDDWGHEAIVIPHGTTWGNYTPRLSDWAKQLEGPMQSQRWQNLFEIYSGHGNSEEYREWRGMTFDDDGNRICPEPSEGYNPSCWRAGEVIKERCLAKGNDAADCEERAARARQYHVNAWIGGIGVVDAVDNSHWLDAGQCRDCFMPSFKYRPMGSAQYVMALTNFDDPENPRRFDFGFMGASDNHKARPGTGFKETNRNANTESGSGLNPDVPLTGLLAGLNDPNRVVSDQPVEISPNLTAAERVQLLVADRAGTYLYTGGLTAAHSSGRDRGAIWDAFQRQEVYGTSGPRILLWFNAEQGGDVTPMGGELSASDSPVFKVAAIGSFEQKPGCPDMSTVAMGPEKLANICQGECYHPSDTRRLITRIEVVRVRPQSYKDEPIADLIEDPWKVIDCVPDRAGCAAEFTDPDFASSGRDALYYVRAIEEPGLAVNAAGARCTFDEEGNCIASNFCDGQNVTPDDDCLAPIEERAWSSPIFVGHGG